MAELPFAVQQYGDAQPVTLLQIPIGVDIDPLHLPSGRGRDRSERGLHIVAEMTITATEEAQPPAGGPAILHFVRRGWWRRCLIRRA